MIYRLNLCNLINHIHANVTTGDFNMPYCQDYIQIFNEVVMGLYDDYDKQLG